MKKIINDIKDELPGHIGEIDFYIDKHHNTGSFSKPNSVYIMYTDKNGEKRSLKYERPDCLKYSHNIFGALLSSTIFDSGIIYFHNIVCKCNTASEVFNILGAMHDADQLDEIQDCYNFTRCINCNGIYCVIKSILISLTSVYEETKIESMKAEYHRFNILRYYESIVISEINLKETSFSDYEFVRMIKSYGGYLSKREMSMAKAIKQKILDDGI